MGGLVGGSISFNTFRTFRKIFFDLAHVLIFFTKILPHPWQDQNKNLKINETIINFLFLVHLKPVEKPVLLVSRLSWSPVIKTYFYWRRPKCLLAPAVVFYRRVIVTYFNFDANRMQLIKGGHGLGLLTLLLKGGGFGGQITDVLQKVILGQF